MIYSSRSIGSQEMPGAIQANPAIQHRQEYQKRQNLAITKLKEVLLQHIQKGHSKVSFAFLNMMVQYGTGIRWSSDGGDDSLDGPHQPRCGPTRCSSSHAPYAMHIPQQPEAPPTAATMATVGGKSDNQIRKYHQPL